MVNSRVRTFALNGRSVQDVPRIWRVLTLTVMTSMDVSLYYSPMTPYLVRLVEGRYYIPVVHGGTLCIS